MSQMYFDHTFFDMMPVSRCRDNYQPRVDCLLSPSVKLENYPAMASNRVGEHITKNNACCPTMATANIYYLCRSIFWPRSTMDSIRVSEAPDSGSIPDEATIKKAIIYLVAFCQLA
jgi:hypothetical protein